MTALVVIFIVPANLGSAAHNNRNDLLMNAPKNFSGGSYRFAVRRVFCCVSCCSALVNALRAVLSDSVTELSLFRASEMALSFPCLLPGRRALLCIKNGKGCPAIFSSSDNPTCPEYLFLRSTYSASISAAFLSCATSLAVFSLFD